MTHTANIIEKLEGELGKIVEPTEFASFEEKLTDIVDYLERSVELLEDEYTDAHRMTRDNIDDVSYCVTSDMWHIKNRIEAMLNKLPQTGNENEKEEEAEINHIADLQSPERTGRI